MKYWGKNFNAVLAISAFFELKHLTTAGTLLVAALKQ
jgi:hypothetical protein